MRDRYQRDRARRRRLVLLGRGLQRLELASRGGVEDVPPAGAELIAYRIGRLEVALAPALDAISQQLVGL
jgi:hypothetical protein